MKSFLISKEESQMRLSRFIEKNAPSLSQSGMYKAIRTKHIKVNGKRTEASYKLQENDTVEIWLDDTIIGTPNTASRPDFMNASKEISIIYEDENIAIVYKPSGLFSHPVKGQYSDTLISRYLRYLYEKHEFDPSYSFTPALCNRLDRNTSGLVIIGKSLNSVSEINKMISERNIVKRYYAVTVGTCDLNGIYKAYWKKDEAQNQVTIFDMEKPNTYEIITEFHTIKRNNGLSLIEAILHTGRTHQIRAHLSHLGFPVLGDPKYGISSVNKRYKQNHQLLISYAITFNSRDNSTFSYLDGMTFSIPCDPFPDFF